MQPARKVVAPPGGSRPRDRRPSRRLRQEALALLERASELIARRDRFTRGPWARDRHSHPVDFDSERAVRFCAAGALLRAEIDLYGGRVLEVDGRGSFRPQRLDLALAYVGYRLCRAHSRKLGLILLECPTLESALEDASEPELSQLRELLERPTYDLGWAPLVVGLGDRRDVSHSDVLRAFYQAISDAEADLAPRAAKKGCRGGSGR